MIVTRSQSGELTSMTMTADGGMLPDLTGGYDAMAEIRQALGAAMEAHPKDIE